METNHGLRIADTPMDDVKRPEETASSVASNLVDCHTAMPCVTDKYGCASAAIRIGRTGRRKVQRLSREEVDQEIERVNRLNRKPAIEIGTYPDEGAHAETGIPNASTHRT